jgi:predicted class III extradiol MEMO1 family dioxygenase
MVTAAHGKGVSVCEMLVLDQTKETMKRCLEFFTSLVDATKTETFIIDKDFTEWAVINETLPSAKVRYWHSGQLTGVFWMAAEFVGVD